MQFYLILLFAIPVHLPVYLPTYSQPDKALLCLQDVEKSSLKSLDAVSGGAVEAISRQEVKQAIWRAKFAAFGK